MPPDGLRLPSSASVTSLTKPNSVRSTRAPPSTLKPVVTAPPWARDEPPSPTEGDRPTSSETIRHPLEYRVSDVTSYASSDIPEDPGPSRWWIFTRHRHSSSQTDQSVPLTSSPLRKGLREWDRSLSIPWLGTSNHQRSSEGSPVLYKGHENGLGSPFALERPLFAADPLHVDIPPPPSAPYTIAQNATPGWDTPWTARPLDLVSRGRPTHEDIGELPTMNGQADHNEKVGSWAKRKKRIRTYMIYNPYVPLLFRFINIAFTTAALAVAIRIRMIERENGVMGAVGSSPTLVVIFGSLTLVHVMIAIYVEYFGRPVGLWHTSSKLAYTLIEVVFICAWSAALALSFDNFFTSLIPCASDSNISWYSELPRPMIAGLTNNEGTVGDSICDDQLALICLNIRESQVSSYNDYILMSSTRATGISDELAKVALSVDIFTSGTLAKDAKKKMACSSASQTTKRGKESQYVQKWSGQDADPKNTTDLWIQIGYDDERRQHARLGDRDDEHVCIPWRPVARRVHGLWQPSSGARYDEDWADGASILIQGRLQLQGWLGRHARRGAPGQAEGLLGAYYADIGDSRRDLVMDSSYVTS
ncbi:uncharacterized protein FIBRA_00990 [Fibroporia radiculosa]|uniref:Uncharacterized protein n=1 Tax=Fibroporia radiculosa TaxID=599839 RepID=J4HSK6_9APHY|nr:uncharacterized protein FIBRA_00990 [Fibroporia radiculosa]CCL98982.1 predicted protein [Fibroporia radiculosa]